LKPVLFALTCIAVCLLLLHAQSNADGQLPEQLPGFAHQVGLIDMAYVFKNSAEFKSLTDELQQAITKTDHDAKEIVDRIRHLQSQLNAGPAEPGSPEYQKLEDQIVRGKTELESFKRVAQQSFLRKEAEIYKSVYLEVEDAVARYAAYYKYTLILRFDRQEVTDQDDPQEIMNGMHRNIVYYRAGDDITDPILKFLNDQWSDQTHRDLKSQTGDPQTTSQSGRQPHAQPALKESSKESSSSNQNLKPKETNSSRGVKMRAGHITR